MAVPWPEIAAHRERLVRVARRRCPTREDAEDVVHEAMLRCATFEELDERRLGQFLTAVTLRLCADVYRGTERAERGLRALRSLDAGTEPSPEDLACRAAESDELRAMLDALPDRQRAVLVDRAFGLSVTQISERNALTYKATESTLSRARATMRVALASAMSLVGALVATVRRRPAVALAAPLTALVAVSTVQHLPFGAGAPRTVPAPASRALGGGQQVVAWERPSGANAPAFRAPRLPVPGGARSGRSGAGNDGANRERTVFAIEDGPVQGKVTNSEEHVTDIVWRCAEADEYRVDVRVEPEDPEEQFSVLPRCESRHGNQRSEREGVRL